MFASDRRIVNTAFMVEKKQPNVGRGTQISSTKINIKGNRQEHFYQALITRGNSQLAQRFPLSKTMLSNNEITIK